MSVEDKVADLLENKKITTEDAAELLQAGRDRSLPSPWQWLLAPATRMARSTRLAVTLVIVAASVAVARLLHVRFDGSLDVHLTSAAIPWAVIFLDVLAYLPLTAGVLFLVARVCGSCAAFLDMLTAVGVARVAMLLQALAALAFVPAPPADATLPPPTAGTLFGALLILPLLIWGVAMLFFHLRAATGLRGGRLAAAFIVGLIFAEVASKVLLAIV